MCAYVGAVVRSGVGAVVYACLGAVVCAGVGVVVYAGVGAVVYAGVGANFVISAINLSRNAIFLCMFLPFLL